MHRFAVWAPERRRVDVVVDGRRHAMHHVTGGWWEATVEEAGPGARYGCSLDGGPVRPDPRSAFQPDGVLGLSQVIDQAAFEWHDAGWSGVSLRDLILYELHIGTFSPVGTFDGAIEHLPHLAGLGVTAVELMPVAEFSGEHGWGYDGVDLYAPHHAYGGPAGMKRFVDACHRLGLAVVLDVVYNHLGPVGNFLADFGPYFSDRHHTAWGSALNFDGEGSESVRRHVVDNALMWVRDYHVDGLRLDAIQAIVDESPRHILEQLGAEVHELGRSIGRSVLVIAESDLNEPRLVRPRDEGGYALDAAWADDWHHALHTVLTAERVGYYADFGSLTQLAKALRQAWVYDGEWSPHRKRIRGGPAAGLRPESFVVAAQTHDQVGNRRGGERLSAMVAGPLLKAAAALLLTSPFTPLLFQGEEWGARTPFLYFTSHEDPSLGRAVAEGRRREFKAFGWDPQAVPDPQDPATFERSRLDWNEIEELELSGILDWYRDLIALRRRLPAAAAPVGAGVDVTVDESARRLSFSRQGVRVDLNLGDDEWMVEAPKGGALAMCSRRVGESGNHSVAIPPFGAAIFETGQPID